MPSLPLSVAAALGIAGLLHRVRVGHRAWRTYRGIRIVTCPHTVTAAAVEVDRALAALSAPLGRAWLWPRRCSRWPAQRGCSRACRAEIAASPIDSLDRSLVARWVAGQACARCGQRFGGDPGSGFGPALLRADGTSVDWHDLPAESLREQLRSHRPVCWYCHVVARLRQERPDIVVAPRRESLRE